VLARAWPEHSIFMSRVELRCEKRRRESWEGHLLLSSALFYISADKTIAVLVVPRLGGAL